MLIQSKLKPNEKAGVSGKVLQNFWDPCNVINCYVCKLLKTSTFTCKSTGELIKTVEFCQCQTTNVIYLLQCSKCQIQYIGETKRPFVARLKEHFADIKHRRDKPVALHINNHDGDNSKIIPYILEVVNKNPQDGETTVYRRKRELHWIYKLKTLAPLGLNTLG